MGCIVADVIFVVATLAFFTICVLYVQWCDRIIGPDISTQSVAERSTEQTNDEVKA
jgi:hypothetical protein